MLLLLPGTFSATCTATLGHVVTPIGTCSETLEPVLAFPERKMFCNMEHMLLPLWNMYWNMNHTMIYLTGTCIATLEQDVTPWNSDNNIGTCC